MINKNIKFLLVLSFILVLVTGALGAGYAAKPEPIRLASIESVDADSIEYSYYWERFPAIRCEVQIYTVVDQHVGRWILTESTDFLKPVRKFSSGILSVADSPIVDDYIVIMLRLTDKNGNVIVATDTFTY